MATPGTQLTVVFEGAVYVSFGADSVVQPADWQSLCAITGPLNSRCALKGATVLPVRGYLNATFAFGAPVGCGSTKAEVNINNPKWFDVLDVSLVDGASNAVGIVYTAPGSAPVQLGPNVRGDNSKVFGVFPLGCDICTARQNPPCGIAPGKDGCKKGTQYKPDVPCQVQGTIKGGGGTVVVSALPWR